MARFQSIHRVRGVRDSGMRSDALAGLVSAFREAPDSDYALALVAFVSLLVDPVLRGRGSDLSVASGVLAAITSLALVIRRRYPVGVLIAVAAGLLACLALSHPNRAAAAVVMLAVFTVGLQGRRVRSLVVGAAMAPLVVAAIFVTAGAGPEPVSAVAYVAVVLAALTAGDALRGRRALRDAAAEDVEREREAATQHRLDEQRLRLAHELHDALAHTLVGINVRAAAAARSLGSAHGEGLAALEEITRTSADALTELRSTLKMLRPAAGEAPLRPAQTLADLGALADGVRGTGLAVELELDATPDELPYSIEHAAYRIVQEALTNVLRHSTAARVVVGVSRTEDKLTVVIADDGLPLPRHRAGSGHGLQGMAERAVALGGSCEAGADPQGGWRVRASLPLKAGT
jgi:signal transduction histidine kinase